MNGPRLIGLVGCVKQKRSIAARARDLYTSPLFLGRLAYVERTCGRWFILSAEHGLLEPDRVVEPYDRTLLRMSVADRRAWSDRVLADLLAAVGPVEGVVFEFHAGAAYRDRLAPALRERGAAISNPTEGLSIGLQLRLYGSAGS